MEKGLYFIATITRIERCEDYMIATHGMGDASFRNHHCFINYPLIINQKTGKYWEENDPRYAIYFDNTVHIPIQKFSSIAFDFPMMPIIYLP